MDALISKKMPSRTSGFSLLEILVAAAVMILLIGLALPAFNSIRGGTTLSNAGNTLLDTFALARLRAAGRNEDISIRFYSAKEGSWTAIQTVIPAADPADARSLDPIRDLPAGFVVSDASSISPLLANLNQNSVSVPGRGNLRCKEIRFKPDGSLDGAVTTTNNFITLLTERDLHKVPAAPSGGLDANFYVLQINPITGGISYYRP